MPRKILLHICCGVCSSAVVEHLKKEDFEITGFFYNPNIQPQVEYEKRLDVAREVSRILDFPLIEGEYDTGKWFELIRGLEQEVEGAKRCKVCFKMRLDASHNKSEELDISQFVSTLSISPHKDTSIINRIGRNLAKERFLATDFKKDDSFKKTLAFAKKHNLYRQNYCGCIYSAKEIER